MDYDHGDDIDNAKKNTPAFMVLFYLVWLCYSTGYCTILAYVRIHTHGQNCNKMQLNIRLSQFMCVCNKCSHEL